MKKKKFLKKLLKEKIVILDGATGTELQKRGKLNKTAPEIFCLHNPEIISNLQREYVKSGSEIIYTPTFGANRFKLAQYGYYEVEAINRKLALISKNAAGSSLVAGSIGPLGEFIEPSGKVNFEKAVDVFKEQVRGLLKGGVDIFVIETMIDIQEARAALLAVKELTDKFVMVTLTFEKEGTTLTGTDPITALITLQSLGADAVGCNCSLGPDNLKTFIEKMKVYAGVPLVAKPNAGLPQYREGKTYFDMDEETFSRLGREIAAAGANLIGGCCGTTPSYIKMLTKKLKNVKPRPSLKRNISALTSSRKTVFISPQNLIMVGECINPTGKRSLAESLRNKDFSFLRKLGRQQEEAGALILDVNVSLPHTDEPELLKQAVKVLSLNCSSALSLDSSNPQAIEAALRLYPGRALINSISAEKERMKKLLPLAAKYGAMFILLPIKKGLFPHKFFQRQRIIKEVFAAAKRLGLGKESIVVDGLTLTISTDAYAAEETIKTISWASKTFKTATILGLSNISFGLPKRELINSTFLAMLASSGLNMVIANPLSEEIMATKRALDLLQGRDKNAAVFCNFYKRQKEGITRFKEKFRDEEEKIFSSLVEGEKDKIIEHLKQALKNSFSPQAIVDKVIIPALKLVGDKFDKKEYFLPQLVASAEAAKVALHYLQPYLEKKTESKLKKAVIIMATVEGDIHDIGKNIVSLMLKNNGFLVIDLGKDVPDKKIIESIKKHSSSLVGLSALMTTTMVNMKKVIDKAREHKLDCRFIVGGAAVTESYAHSIGAEYAKDALEAVRLANKLI